VMELAQAAGVQELVLVHSAMDRRVGLKQAVGRLGAGQVRVTLAEGQPVSVTV